MAPFTVVSASDQGNRCQLDETQATGVERVLGSGVRRWLRVT